MPLSDYELKVIAELELGLAEPSRNARIRAVLRTAFLVGRRRQLLSSSFAAVIGLGLIYVGLGLASPIGVLVAVVGYALTISPSERFFRSLVNRWRRNISKRTAGHSRRLG